MAAVRTGEGDTLIPMNVNGHNLSQKWASLKMLREIAYCARLLE